MSKKDDWTPTKTRNLVYMYTDKWPSEFDTKPIIDTDSSFYRHCYDYALHKYHSMQIAISFCVWVAQNYGAKAERHRLARKLFDTTS